MEDKKKILEEIRGIEYDNIVAREGLKLHTEFIIKDLNEHKMNLIEKPVVKKIPLLLRVKWSLNRIINKLSNTLQG